MLALALLAAATPLVSAHAGCGSHEIGRRNPGGKLIPKREPAWNTMTKRQNTETSVAAEDDPTTECTAYSYEVVTDIKANYPTIWDTATIVAGDTVATELFATINASVNAALPNDLPHGTTTGDFTGVTYNSTDPDCWWSWHQCTTPAADTGLPADIVTVPEPMTWGFGFDDGPNCSHNALYDFLSENNQKATMFYIGSNVMDWPLQAMRAIDDGHHICVHTWSHLYMTALSNEEVFAELYYTRSIIKEILGVTPTCWRPPYGDVDNRVRYIANQLNLTNIVWDHDTDDWKQAVPSDNVTAADVDANYEGIIAGASNGSYATYGPVVLNHELNNFTMSEMIKFYSQIKSAFNHIVPIATAMNWTTPYVETNYTYPDFATYVAGNTNQTVSNATTSTSSSSSTSSGSTSATSSAATASGSSSTSTASAAGRADVPVPLLSALVGAAGLALAVLV
ncbi:chitin deacetylase [Cryptotrichosporon argae]